MTLLRVRSGKNDLVFGDDGKAYIDLISSTGAAFLGHANDAVNGHIAAQLDRISCCWTSPLAIQDECKEQVGHHLDDDHRLLSLFSSGMEAAEVAMRIAFHETKRTGIVGFRNNNHGKSVATQNISRVDRDVPRLDGFRQLPFLPDLGEADILDELEREVSSTHPAAVFVEAMQGKGGGHGASKDFYGAVQRICRDHGVLIVCDEIFTGFYRTGSCFRYSALDIRPDIVLIGKAVANGFPAAGVVLHQRLGYHPKDLRLSSTFSDNPLACAAVVGTLAEMERIDVAGRVAHVEAALAGIDAGPSADVRLLGAACFIELESEQAAGHVHDHLADHQILALRRGAIVGLWPPATITDEHLDRVVTTTNEAMLAGVR
jgi:acetylornithine/N-succinyldiaminopimelate aminotransferase